MTASLQPVSGDPRSVLALIRRWLQRPDEPEPLMVRTSGSSGHPKDVVLSRDAMVASARATHARLGGPGQWLLDLPVQYVAGLQVLLRSALAGTEPVIAAEHDSLPAAVGAMAGPRRYVPLVPTQLHRLAEHGRLDVLREVDAVLIGGASMPPDLAARATAAGVRVVRTYGMTETSGGCVYDGVGLDGVGVRIDAGRQVWLTGPMLFERYDDDPERSSAVLQDGWFATGDLGEIDADGRLRIIGRADDVVISGGVNVGLTAVGEALRRCPGVREAAAVGVDDAEWGVRVVACIVGGARLDALRDAVRDAGLPRSWAPQGVARFEGLPLLANGKVDRVRLRALAASATSGTTP